MLAGSVGQNVDAKSYGIIMPWPFSHQQTHISQPFVPNHVCAVSTFVAIRGRDVL